MREKTNLSKTEILAEMSDLVKKINKEIFANMGQVDLSKPEESADHVFVNIDMDEALNRLKYLSEIFYRDFLCYSLLTSRELFYGVFLNDIDFKIDFNLPAPAAIKMYGTPIIFMNPMLWLDYDGNRYTRIPGSTYYLDNITGEFLNEDQVEHFFDFGQCLFMLIHEINHYVLKSNQDQYLIRPKYQDSLNIGADININEIIMREAKDLTNHQSSSNIVLIPNKINNGWYAETLEKLTGRKVDSMQATPYFVKIYEDYMDKQKKNQSKSEGDSDGGSGSGSTKEYDPNSGNSQNQKSHSAEDAYKDDEIKDEPLRVTDKHHGGIASKYHKYNNVHYSSSEADAEEHAANAANTIANVAKKCQEMGRGVNARSLLDALKRISEPPKLQWTKIIPKAIGNNPVPYKLTINRRNRRQPMRTDLRGRLSDRICNLVVCQDTSGSMSDDIIAECHNEIINGIMHKANSKVTLDYIEFDADVSRVTENIRKVKDFPNDVSGRGGTSFTPTIEYINKHPRKYRNSVVIIFTDGYGDSEIPVPKCYKLFWVITDPRSNNNYLSVREPYGVVLNLYDDNKFKKYRN